MVSEEVIEDHSNQVTPLICSTRLKTRLKKKRKIKNFFSNEDVVLVLFSILASAIIIILMLVAGTIGASFPTNGWWF